MFVLEYYGESLTHQKVVPGDTITSLNSEMYTYTERYLAYTSGGTTEIAVGDWIVGATGAAKARVLSVTLDSGTWAGGDAAGHFIINSQHGSFQSENLKVAGGTNDATIAANSRLCTYDEYVNKTFYKKNATAALINVYAQTALVDISGAKPDQTALVGQPIAAGGNWMLRDPKAIRSFKCVDYTSGSASTIQCTFFYK